MDKKSTLSIGISMKSLNYFAIFNRTMFLIDEKSAKCSLLLKTSW